MAFDGKFGPDVPLLSAGYGFKTPFGLMLPPGGRVAAFVRSTGIQNLDDDSIRNNLVTTLSSGLARCRSGLGDTVILLPGHSESVVDNTMLTNLVAGTKIIGVGFGSSAPTFRWTATGSQWVMNKADVQVVGCRLRMEGANGVVKAVAVTGADNLFVGNDIEVASGAALKATIGIEAGAGSDRFQFTSNRVRGTATHNVTDGLLVASAVANVIIDGNYMIFSATAGNGCVRFSAAATELMISNNRIFNTHTASTACIAFANVAATGMASSNHLASISTGAMTTAVEGIAFAGANVLVRCFNNYVCNDKQASGLLLPTVDT